MIKPVSPIQDILSQSHPLRSAQLANCHVATLALKNALTIMCPICMFVQCCDSPGLCRQGLTATAQCQSRAMAVTTAWWELEPEEEETAISGDTI